MTTPINARRLTLPDGTDIAYGVHGDGLPLVLTNGLTTSTNFWGHLRPAWLQRHRVLSWDLPGHGSSGPARSTQSATIAEQPEILARLMDAAEMPRAVQIGWSTGCQVVLEFARRYPDRCAALVLLLGAGGRALDTARLPLPGFAIDWLVRHTPRRAFGPLVRAVAHASNWPGGHLLPRLFHLIGPGTSHADAKRITEHLTTIDPDTVQTMVASAQEHSSLQSLGELSLPTFIAAGDQDPFAPADQVGIPMHAAIADSELLRLPEGTHTALLDHAATIGPAVEDFITRRVRESLT